jgi:hypothetical protein
MSLADLWLRLIMSAESHSCFESTARHQQLLETSVRWLLQASHLVASLPDQVYCEAPPGFPAHRVSAHLRHILEFYECLLDGLESGRVDYDARKRNVDLESSRVCALDVLLTLVERLRVNVALRDDVDLLVRMEDAPSTEAADCYLRSSACRELQVLSSHTIHHFALIAMTLVAHGRRVDPDFGVAPSTLRHREQVRKAASSAEAA